MYLLKLGMLTAFRDLVWRKHEAENSFTVANLQQSWCQSKELYQTAKAFSGLSKYQNVIYRLINFYLAFFFFLRFFLRVSAIRCMCVESAYEKIVKKNVQYSTKYYAAFMYLHFPLVFSLLLLE